MSQFSGCRVVVVAYEGQAMFELGIATEMFGLPRTEVEHWYNYRVCSCEERQVRATAGLSVVTHGGLGLLRALSKADIIVLPGWRGIDSPAPAALLRALNRAHVRGVRILSFCSAAFVLAEAGLLDGRRAATHWRFAAELAGRYPAVTVEPDVLYVEDGNLFTSAGSAAAIDLCLHVIRQDWGAETANAVARRLVVSPYREGGQAQFIDASVAPPSTEDGIEQATTWAQSRLGAQLDVETLAKKAKMSSRTFARRFRAQMGTTPHRWLVRQRIFAVQRLLETSDASIEELTDASGLGSSANLRSHFHRAVGLSPQAYRASFRGTGLGAPR